jgi:hypothetical protein
MPPSRIFLSSPHIGPDELELVKEAFATNWIAPLGPHVDAFEQEFGRVISGYPVSVIGDGEMSPAGTSSPTNNPQRITDNPAPSTNNPQPITPPPAIHCAALSSGTAGDGRRNPRPSPDSGKEGGRHGATFGKPIHAD